jgi:hypothetical protein
MAQQKQNLLLDLGINIIIPSVILMKLSGDQHLGTLGALLLAIAFPLTYGTYEMVKHKKAHFVSILGLISVLLTGGIGVLELDNKWLAIKEAAIPGLIGLIVLASTFTPFAFVKKFLFNPAILEIDKINQALAEKRNTEAFERALTNANIMLAGSFAFSSAMNYFLAKWIVTSDTATEAFNEELGQLALLSYPMIALPATVMMFGVLYYLWRSINKLTDLTLEDVLKENLK